MTDPLFRPMEPAARECLRRAREAIHRGEFLTAFDLHRRGLQLTEHAPDDRTMFVTSLLSLLEFEGGAEHVLPVAEEEDRRRPSYWARRLLVEVLNRLSFDLNGRGRSEEAFAVARRILSLEPGSPQGLVAMCNALNSLGDPHGALEAAHAAEKVVPRQPAALVGMCIAFLLLGRHEESLAAALEGLEAEPLEGGLQRGRLLVLSRRESIDLGDGAGAHTFVGAWKELIGALEGAPARDATGCLRSLFDQRFASMAGFIRRASAGGWGPSASEVARLIDVARSRVSEASEGAGRHEDRAEALLAISHFTTEVLDEPFGAAARDREPLADAASGLMADLREVREALADSAAAVDHAAIELAERTLAWSIAGASASERARRLAEIEQRWFDGLRGDAKPEDRGRQRRVLDGLITARAMLLAVAAPGDRSQAFEDVLEVDRSRFTNDLSGPERAELEEGLHRGLELVYGHLLMREAPSRAMPSPERASQVRSLEQSRALLDQDAVWIRAHATGDSLLIAQITRDSMRVRLEADPGVNVRRLHRLQELALEAGQTGDCEALLKALGTEAADPIAAAAERVGADLAKLGAVMFDGDGMIPPGGRVLLSVPPEWMALPWGALPIDGTETLGTRASSIRLVPLASLGPVEMPKEGAALVISQDFADSDDPRKGTPRGELLEGLIRSLDSGGSFNSTMARSVTDALKALDGHRFGHLIAHHGGEAMVGAAGGGDDAMARLDMASVSKALLDPREAPRLSVGSLIVESCGATELLGDREWRFTSLALSLLCGGVSEVLAPALTVWPGAEDQRRYVEAVYLALGQGRSLAGASVEASKAFKEQARTTGAPHRKLPAYAWRLTAIARLTADQAAESSRTAATNEPLRRTDPPHSHAAGPAARHGGRFDRQPPQPKSLVERIMKRLKRLP